MHTNKLINETSPYLLQHAHNPVDWFPWGSEALEKAKAENKPILVSIGYAACHWCHVMERESFENEATAALMNKHFINIKIDREERPDLDHIYMDAVQAMTGSGGWPLNVFLTPQCKPFFGGTYFPPVKAFNRSSWQDVLQGVHTAYTERIHEIEGQAEKLTEHLVTSNAFGTSTTKNTTTVFTKENAFLIPENILKQADNTWGGFGNAPKFPQTFSIQYLLRHYHFCEDENALKQALLSLDKMIYGGIYDQLGGGFARYSTDAKWLAPHFEKMLYDNALLIGVLSEAYQLTKNKLYVETIHHTMQFIQNEMLSEENGFYSALDADSEGVEGKFYTWSKAEIEEVLKEDAGLFCAFFDVSENGNWEHTNILWVAKPIEEFALQNQLDAKLVEQKIIDGKQRLLQKRNTRIRPQLDDKILLSWNALMNTACSKAFAATGDNTYKNLAIANIAFLEKKLQSTGGNWHHTYKNGVAKINAFLDDYAYLIQAYIHLQEITGNEEYLLKAKTITEFVIENFSEAETGFFYFTHRHQQDVIVRKKEVYDGATPSGNSIMAYNLGYLAIIFNETAWKERAENIIQSLGSAIIRYPTSFGVWASLVQQQVAGTNEIAIIGEYFTETFATVLQAYIPNKVLQFNNNAQSQLPLLANKPIIPNKTMYYLCYNYACSKPVGTFGSLLTNISKNYI
jgi:uncharacterized protein